MSRVPAGESAIRVVLSTVATKCPATFGGTGHETRPQPDRSARNRGDFKARNLTRRRITSMDNETLQFLMAIGLGLGLSASCGFRVFVPMLMLSLGVRYEWFEVSAGFRWVESDVATVVLAIATVLEIGAYYIPWIDNVLDTIASPCAVVAGVLVSAAAFGDMDPIAKWSLAIIAGGGSAGIVQTGTVIVRAASSLVTGGLANFLMSTFELLGALFMAVLAIVLPLLAMFFVVVAVVVAIVVLQRWRKSRAEAHQPNA